MGFSILGCDRPPALPVFPGAAATGERPIASARREGRIDPVSLKRSTDSERPRAQGPKEALMRKSRFKEEQIIAILKEVEAGTAAEEVGRKQGVSRQMLYRWKSKYGGMEVSEARRLRQLEDENRL
jgi:putative transposase